jgi:hypothetical protein
VAFLISLIQYIPVTVIGLLLARSLTTDARAAGTPSSAQPTAPRGERNVAVGGEHGRST